MDAVGYVLVGVVAAGCAVVLYKNWTRVKEKAEQLRNRARKQ